MSAPTITSCMRSTPRGRRGVRARRSRVSRCGPRSSPGSDSSPAVANGVVYASSAFLYAFDAAGKTGCSGTPKSCVPLWTATKGGAHSSPAVANGVVYVSSDKLYAFDAAGKTGCSGTPKFCAPLWSALDWRRRGFVAGGRERGRVCRLRRSQVVCVRRGGERRVVRARRSRVPRCGPRPRARVVVSSPAVANGVVYIGSDDHKLYAFDAAGNAGCSGTPKSCAPLWTATTGNAVLSSPAVANGVVYVGSERSQVVCVRCGGDDGLFGHAEVVCPVVDRNHGRRRRIRRRPSRMGSCMSHPSGATARLSTSTP